MPNEPRQPPQQVDERGQQPFGQRLAPVHRSDELSFRWISVQRLALVALEPRSREGLEGIVAGFLGGNETWKMTVAIVATACAISMELAFAVLVRRLPADVAVLFGANNLAASCIGRCVLVHCRKSL